jgi:tetraacyldisaccharide 4'-kinase
VNAVRAVAWLWGGGRVAALARLPLVPVSLVYAAGMRLRAVAYRSGLVTTERLPRPAVAVGNLSVGGTGKTPLAAWIAAQCVARGLTPAILLRGYGADEPLVHRRLVPEAVVVADPDRIAGARHAVERGADVLVLDDAFQLLSVARDVNIAVVSAESAAGSSWPLPAGPWREGGRALERADVIVVTRKRVAREAAEAIADRLGRRRPGTPVSVALLAPSHLEGLQSGTRRGLEFVAGRRVLAAAGIADPVSFGAQLSGLGADVQLVAFQDHHPYSADDVARLVAASAGAYVVVTEKDAVKLRGRWPGDVPEPLVAALSIRWERNGRALEQALDAVLAPERRP